MDSDRPSPGQSSRSGAARLGRVQGRRSTDPYSSSGKGPERESTSGETVTYRNSYALLIGVSDYSEGWNDLPGVRQDITNLYQVLEKQGFQITVLLNPNRDQLDSTIRHFLFKPGLNMNDRLMIYFSGHGVTVHGEHPVRTPYIVPMDSPLYRMGQSEDFQRAALPIQVIDIYARASRAKHVLLIFDSCFAGSVIQLVKSPNSYLFQKTNKPVRQYITAGDEGEVVLDSSVFSKLLARALESHQADYIDDDWLTGAELCEFLKIEVPRATDDRQHPQCGTSKPPFHAGDFVIFLEKETAPPDITRRLELSVEKTTDIAGHYWVWVGIPEFKETSTFWIGTIRRLGDLRFFTPSLKISPPNRRFRFRMEAKPSEEQIVLLEAGPDATRILDERKLEAFPLSHFDDVQELRLVPIP